MPAKTTQHIYAVPIYTCGLLVDICIDARLPTYFPKCLVCLSKLGLVDTVKGGSSCIPLIYYSIFLINFFCPKKLTAVAIVLVDTTFNLIPDVNNYC